jgi:hypothetical protein
MKQMVVQNLAKKRLTDKWLGTVLMPNREYRDYYADNEHGRLTIRMFTGKPAQAVFNRVLLCEVKTQGDVILLATALGIKLER